MHKADIPPEAILYAPNPSTAGYGARKLSRCHEKGFWVDDHRAILINQIPGQHEQLKDSGLGLQVREQRGIRQICSTHIAHHAPVPPLPHMGVALHAVIVDLPCLAGTNSPRDAQNCLCFCDVVPQTNVLEKRNKDV